MQDQLIQTHFGVICVYGIFLLRENNFFIKKISGKKFGPDGIFQDYGYQGKKGDVIGVLLEYKSGLATLSFYRNAVIKILLRGREN